jgi:hypothetical protein
VIWEIVGLGLTAPLWSRYARAHGGFVASFFLFSLLAVCPGLYFRPHYFILLLPAAAVCTGIGVCAVRQTLVEKRSGAVAACLPVIYFALMFGISVRAQYEKFLRLDPASLNQKIFGQDPFSAAVAVGNYIKEHSSEQETVALFGSEPEICFYSARHCASTYLYAYPLMEKQRFAQQMESDMMQQVQQARPRFLVYVDAVRSWEVKPAVEENPELLTMSWAYAHRYYEFVDRVAIAGDPGHRWGDRAYLYIFRRNGP